ncbi:polysaccharide pyruvyl transferase family protein [Afipia sp. TerB]
MTDELDTGAGPVALADRRRSADEGRVGAVAVDLPISCKIGLLEHCGTGNLGDDATVTTVLQQINTRWPAASVVGLSLDPRDSERRLGVQCFPIRQSVFPFEREWSSASESASNGRYAHKLKSMLKRAGPLFRSVKAIKNAFVRPIRFIREIFFLGHSLILTYELDMIIICGGGQLLDWGGPWAFPYTLFKWVVLAKCGRAKCIFLNNGAGPLDASLSRWFIKRALSMADYVSLRDRRSAELVKKIGFQNEVVVAADSAWSLRLPDGIASRKFERKQGLVIGVAPMAYGDPSRHWVDNYPGYQRLIASLAEFSGRMLERGHRIKLFSSDIWFDSQAIADLNAAIHRDYPTLAAGRVTQQHVAGINDLLESLSCLDCYVTCRFHGVVFASLMNVPTLALSPHAKVATLMADMELSDYCIDISKCDADDLVARFDRLAVNMDGVRARIGRHVARSQSLLDSQFDRLFPVSADAEAAKNKQILSVGSVT